MIINDLDLYPEIELKGEFFNQDVKKLTNIDSIFEFYKIYAEKLKNVLTDSPNMLSIEMDIKHNYLATYFGDLFYHLTLIMVDVIAESIHPNSYKLNILEIDKLSSQINNIFDEIDCRTKNKECQNILTPVGSDIFIRWFNEYISNILSNQFIWSDTDIYTIRQSSEQIRFYINVLKQNNNFMSSNSDLRLAKNAVQIIDDNVSCLKQITHDDNEKNNTIPPIDNILRRKILKILTKYDFIYEETKALSDINAIICCYTKYQNRFIDMIHASKKSAILLPEEPITPDVTNRLAPIYGNLFKKLMELVGLYSNNVECIQIYCEHFNSIDCSFYAIMELEKKKTKK